MLIGGLDCGNRKQALSLPGMEGKDAIIIPTIYAQYQKYDGLKNKRKNLMDSLDVEITLNYNKSEDAKYLGHYLVGNGAIETEGINAVKREMGAKKAGDMGLFICALTTLAYGAVLKQNKFEGKVTQEYSFVTGLPFAQYKSEDEQNRFKLQFLGKHKVKFGGNYDIDVELNITGVDVDCEGAGPLKKSLFNESGDYKYPEEELVDRILIGIDVGEFTFEVIAIKFIEDGDKVVPEFVSKLCMGDDKGIANAKEPIINFIREEFGTTIDRYTIDKVIKRSKRRGLVDLENGATFDITESYDTNLKKLAYTISEMINNRVKASGEKGKILDATLFGGGPCTLDNKMGNYMIDNLKSMLELNDKQVSENMVHEKIKIADNAETANSDGYLGKALALFEK